MKFIIAAVVFVFVTLVMVSLRSSRLESEANAIRTLELKHKEALKSKAVDALADCKISKSSISIKDGDVTIGGLADTADNRNLVGEKINQIEGLSLKDADNHVTVEGYIAGEKSSGVFTLTGHINNAEILSSKLVSSTGFPIVKGAELEEAHYYIEPAIVHDPRFKVWLSNYMKPGGSRSFLLKGNTITLEGATTLKIEAAMMKELRALDLKTVSKLAFYPSEINFPSYSYKTNSILSTEELAVLNHELAMTKVLFESGASNISPLQFFKLDIAAEVIKVTGSRARFIIGGHTDSAGDIEANKALSAKRVNNVLGLLKERGISSELFQVVTFDAAPAGSESRSVEIRVK